MVLNEFTNKVARNLGFPGFMLSSSKTMYRESYPKNYVIFNGNVIVDGKKVWYGDVDISKSGNKLKELAIKENVDIHVLYEHDARFENEENPPVEKAAASYLKTGEIKYAENVQDKYIL